jgi:hypothetical protein
MDLKGSEKLQDIAPVVSQDATEADIATGEPTTA